MQAEMLMEAGTTSEHPRNDHRPDKQQREGSGGSEPGRDSEETNRTTSGAEPSEPPPTDTCTRQSSTEPQGVTKLAELCGESTHNLGHQESTEEPDHVMESAEGDGGLHSTTASGSHNAIETKETCSHSNSTMVSKESSDGTLISFLESREISDLRLNALDFKDKDIIDGPCVIMSVINDQPYNATGSKEISDQPHNTMESNETSDQPHNTKESGEISDQPCNTMESKKITDQTHTSMESKEITDQAHNTMVAKEITDQPHNTMVAKEITDQPHNSMESKQTSGQPHNIMGSKEIRDQPHISMESKEIGNQPHNTIGSKQISDHPHNTMESKELSDQPHLSMDSEELSDQPHISIGSEEIDDQPHSAKESEEISDQPQNTMDSEEISDKPHICMGSEEIGDQTQNTMDSEEISDQSHISMGSEEIDDQPQNTMDSEEISDHPHIAMESEVISDQPHSTMMSKEISDQPHISMDPEEIRDHPHISMGCEDISDQPHISMESNEISDQPHNSMVSKEIHDQPHIFMESEVIGDQPHIFMESKEIIDQPHNTIESKEISDQPDNTMVCKEISDQPHISMESEVFSDQLHATRGTHENSDSVHNTMETMNSSDAPPLDVDSEERGEASNTTNPKERGGFNTISMKSKDSSEVLHTEAMHKEPSPSETEDRECEDISHKDGHSEEVLNGMPKNTYPNESRVIPHPHIDSTKDSDTVENEGTSKAVSEIPPIDMEHKETDAELCSEIETKETCEDHTTVLGIHEAQHMPPTESHESHILESNENTATIRHATMIQETSYGSYNVTKLHDTRDKPHDTAAFQGGSCSNPTCPNQENNKDGEVKWEAESKEPGIRGQDVHLEAENVVVENTLPLDSVLFYSDEEAESGNASETSHLEKNEITFSDLDLTRTDTLVSQPAETAGVRGEGSILPEEEKLALNEAIDVPGSSSNDPRPCLNEGSAITDSSLGECVAGSRCPHEPPCPMPCEDSVDEAQSILSPNGCETIDSFLRGLGPAAYLSLVERDDLRLKVEGTQHLGTVLVEGEALEISTATVPSATTPQTNTPTEPAEEKDLLKHFDTTDSMASPHQSDLEDSPVKSERQGDIALQTSGQCDPLSPSPVETKGPVTGGSEDPHKSQGGVPLTQMPCGNSLPSSHCVERPEPALEVVPADGGDTSKWGDTDHEPEHLLFTSDPTDEAPSRDRSCQSPLLVKEECAEDLPDAKWTQAHRRASQREGDPHGWGDEHPSASHELPSSFEDLIKNVVPEVGTTEVRFSIKEWNKNEYSEVQTMQCPPQQSATSSSGNVNDARTWEEIKVLDNVRSFTDGFPAPVHLTEEWGEGDMPHSQSLDSGWDQQEVTDHPFKVDLAETFPLASGTDSTFPSEELCSEVRPADLLCDFSMATENHGRDSLDPHGVSGSLNPFGVKVEFMKFLSHVPKLFQGRGEEIGESPASVPGLAEAGDEACQTGGGSSDMTADGGDAEHYTEDGTPPYSWNAGLHAKGINIPRVKKLTSPAMQFINPPAWFEHSPEETMSFFQADITADPLGDPMTFRIPVTPLVPFDNSAASLHIGATIPQSDSVNENETSNEDTPETNLGFHSRLGAETPPMRDFSPAAEDVFVSPQPPLTPEGVMAGTALPESHSNWVPTWKVPDESVIQMLTKKLSSPKLSRSASKVYKPTGGTGAGKEARHRLSTPVLVSHFRLAEETTFRETASVEPRRVSTPLIFKGTKFMKFSRASPEACPLSRQAVVSEEPKWNDQEEDPQPMVVNKSGRWFLRVTEEGAERRDRPSGREAPEHPSVQTLHASGRPPLARSSSWPYDTQEDTEEDPMDPTAAESKSQEELTHRTDKPGDWHRKHLRKPPGALALSQEEADRQAEDLVFSTSDPVTLREKNSPSLHSNITRRQSKLINSSRLLYQEYSDVALNHEIQRQKRAETFMEESEPSSPRLRRKLLSQPDSYLQRLSVSSSASLWQDIPMIRGSSTLLSMTREEQKLQEAKFELIMSEASYLRSLNIAVDHFQHSPDLQALLSNQERQWLFSRLQEVRDVSSDFLFDLEEKFEDNMYTFNVCDVVLSHASDIRKVYLPYVTNQSYQDQTFRQLLSGNPKFQQVLARLEGDPVCQRLSLKSFLILPFQRITRLKLLVQNILKRTRPGSREEAQATQAYNLMEKLIKDCNENVQQMRSTEELIYLSQKIQFECKIFPLISQSRRLVKHGELVELEYSNPLSFKWKVTTRPIYLHLFNDCLLLSRRREGARFLVFDHARASKVRGEKCEVKLHGSNKNIFRLILQENNQGRRVEFLFRTETQSEKLRWISALSPLRKQPDLLVYHDNPQVQCLKSYKARQNDELSLEKADVIMVTQQSKDGWMEGMRLSDGERGWFPVENVEDISNKHVRLRNLKEEQRIQSARAKLLPPHHRR